MGQTDFFEFCDDGYISTVFLMSFDLNCYYAPNSQQLHRTERSVFFIYIDAPFHSHTTVYPYFNIDIAPSHIL